MSSGHFLTLTMRLIARFSIEFIKLLDPFKVECAETSGCEFFMFVEYTTGATACFLLRSCEANATSACSNEPDCQMAVSGPVTPSLVDSCCDEFEEVQCDSKYEVGHEFDVFGEEACQQLCRDELSCSYWTLLGNVCFFYSSCGTPKVTSSFIVLRWFLNPHLSDPFAVMQLLHERTCLS